MIESVSEKFKIKGVSGLNGTDVKSLTRLYLPLIGLDSFGLYSVLTGLNADEEYSFKNLIDMACLKTLKQLDRALAKLEAVGLVHSLVNTDKAYLLETVAPLSPQLFLTDPLLTSFLATEIGSGEVEKLRLKFKKTSKGYKDVSHKFADVFAVKTSQDPFSAALPILKAEPAVENQDFNYSLFKMLFSSTYVPESVLNADEFRKNIIRLSFVYKLDEEAMKDVVFQSLDKDQKLDYATLSQNARNLFQKKYKVTSPRVVSKEEDPYLKSDADATTIGLCNRLEAMSPSQVLEVISGMKATPSELRIAEDLLANTKLSRGAVNFMLWYVAKEKGGELPAYNYFEKIASTWSRAKVKTALDAINYTQKRNLEHRTGGRKTEMETPTWYEAYEKNLHQEKPDKASEPLSKELNDLFDSLFEE